MSADPATTSILRRCFQPPRIIVAGLSIGVLLWLAQRIDTTAILGTLRQARLSGLVAAIGILGLSLSLGAWRWHQMLRLNGIDAGFAFSWRLSIMGHSFSSLLLGAAISDVAKSTLYSRWTDIPTSRVLAASALDRLAGAASTLLYGIAVVALAAQASLPGLDWSMGSLIGSRWGWAFVLLLLPPLSGLWVLRRRWLPHALRFLEEFKQGWRLLASRPGFAAKAIGAGLVIQVLISTVLALALHSVWPKSAPWLDMAWTFPVIGVVASLPITLSGAGAREAAACVLWAPFGIDAATAFSAGILALAVNLTWALIGLLLATTGRTSAADALNRRAMPSAGMDACQTQAPRRS